MLKIPHGPVGGTRKSAVLICGLMLLAVLPLVSGADADGDGYQDSVDDCPFAAGTSTVDRTGCPDDDGDGTSNLNDGWSSNNPNFAQDFHISGTSVYSVDHNSDGTLVAAAIGTCRNRQIRRHRQHSAAGAIHGSTDG